MPAGCDFICNNTECEQHKSGFSLTAPWPLGKIELIISNINTRLPNQDEYKAQLQQWKDEGRKLASLILPNSNKIPVEGYRVQMWDDAKNCVWNYDIILAEGETIEDATKREVPTEVEGRKIKSFNKAIEDGIKCPYCKQPMMQSRWFSNNE